MKIKINVRISNKMNITIVDVGNNLDNFLNTIRSVHFCCSTWKENRDWLETKTDEHQPQAIHDNALKCLAKTSALAINKYHKLAELLLIKDHHSTVNESDCLLQ